MRMIRVGAAQLGPIQKAESRAQVLARLLNLLEQARARECGLVVYPELALTTFFPRWLYASQAEIDVWFERSMPNPEIQPLFDRARKYGIGFSLGYAELTPDGHHFNTQILVDETGAIVGKYRKVHLPGHVEYLPELAFQHLEKRYFEPGDLGFPVWRTMGGVMGMCICNDRRWPETWRVMGLQGAELIVLGYNTPSANPWSRAESADTRMFHNHLSIQAGAYQNSAWAVAVAKAGTEDDHHLIGGSCIVDPEGRIVALAQGEGDELLVHDLDLDRTAFGRQTIFNFAEHRRIEHYGLIASQTGVVPPP